MVWAKSLLNGLGLCAKSGWLDGAVRPHPKGKDGAKEQQADRSGKRQLPTT
jgi:hypothetical protein